MQLLFLSQLHELHEMLPWVAIHREKQAMRAIDSQKRRILSPEQIQEASTEVIARLESSQHFQNAKVIMVYFPVHNEIDLRPLVTKYENDKTFLFPCVTRHRHQLIARVYHHHTPFKKGRLGIPEPDTEEYKGHIDMVLVPGISFDKQRYRIGRGGGYYDKFLAKFTNTFKVGVAYDFQIHDEVPRWIKDQQLNRIVTPTQTI